MPVVPAKLSDMTAQSDTRYTQTDDIADLHRLGAALAARGYRAAVQTPAGQIPHLTVTNPRARVLTEKAYVEGTSYRWSWAERISGRDDAAGAAGILARVLRTVES